MKPKDTIIASPMDTTIRILVLDIPPKVTEETCLASTRRPGSAIEIKKPKIKPETVSIHNLLVLVRLDPIRLPSGVIPISTPIRKIVNPKITKIAPIRNLMVRGVPRGTRVKFNISTIIVIGRTDDETSFIFSVNIFIVTSLPFHEFIKNLLDFLL